MVDHSIKGSSIVHRLLPDSSGGALLSARFVVAAGGPHSTLGFSGDDQHPIKWDPTPEKDDIGIPADISSNGNVFLPDGDYLITVSAEQAPDTAATTGQMILDIETASSTTNSMQTADFQAGANPEASVTTMHTMAGGTGSFKVNVHTVNVDDSSTVAKAALTITKLS